MPKSSLARCGGGFNGLGLQTDPLPIVALSAPMVVPRRDQPFGFPAGWPDHDVPLKPIPRAQRHRIHGGVAEPQRIMQQVAPRIVAGHDGDVSEPNIEYEGGDGVTRFVVRRRSQCGG
jgi:hypothetical protein